VAYFLFEGSGHGESIDQTRVQQEQTQVENGEGDDRKKSFEVANQKKDHLASLHPRNEPLIYMAVRGPRY
jgi:hypothetical protein